MTAARKPRPLNLSSHTELSTLTQCERRWRYQYIDKIRGDKSLPMILGSTMGVTCDAFWRHEDWRMALAVIICEAEAEAGGYEPSPPDAIDLDQVTAEPYATAYWLGQRYERFYADMLDEVEVEYTELDCRAKIPGTTQVHQAIIDNIFKIGRRRYMVERKTYGKTEKLDLVDVDPQLTNNLWVAREHTGLKIDGIIFDGIYTYRWKAEKPTQQQLIDEALAAEGFPVGVSTMKPNERREWARAAVLAHPGVDRPDSESFEMLFLDRTPKHVAAAQKEIAGQLRRRAQLRRGVQPMRNIGPFCKNCPAKSDCFSDLAFPQSDIVLVP